MGLCGFRNMSLAYDICFINHYTSKSPPTLIFVMGFPEVLRAAEKGNYHANHGNHYT